METASPLSIVIVNYRSANRIARLLESFSRIEDGFGKRSRIIVVNNDPLESRALERLSHAFQFSLVENHSNTGFAQGANIGALAAPGEIIGFINPDTLWKQPSLSSLFRMFQIHPHIGIIGMRLISPSGLPEPFSFGNHHSIFEIFRNNLIRPKKHSIEKSVSLIPTSWVSGGSLFIRKSVFQELGGFDERFFLYFEDADLCLRTEQSGWKTCVASALPLFHDGGKSQSSPQQQKRCFYASQNAYFEKHRPRWEYLLLRIIRFIRHGI